MKAKATLADLCSESSSPIAKVQDKIVGHLEGWGENAPLWQLFHCVGGSPNEHRSILRAKESLLQLSVACLDHFELRMCNPPYSPTGLADPHLAADRRRQIATAFLRAPQHCLSLFCIRLRERYPELRSLLGEGRHLIEAWSTSTFVGIDWTERMHGRMRQDLRSEKRARSFARAANTMMCQELRSVHIAAGGDDPGKLGRVPWKSLADPSGDSPNTDSGAGQGAKGGNPYYHFKNHKFRVHTQVFCPGRSMQPAEQVDLEAKCKLEWSKMGEGQ